MAKKEETENVVKKGTIAEQRNTTPDMALRQDWPKMHNELAPFITIKGKVRGGIGLKEQEKAKKILSEYGFKV